MTPEYIRMRMEDRVLPREHILWGRVRATVRMQLMHPMIQEGYGIL